MCPISLDVSCGALPFPAGLGGGWLGVLSHGTVGSWCCCEIPGRSLGGLESAFCALCLLRDRHWLQRSEIAACAAHWIQEHSISKDLCLGSSSSVIRGLLDGISVKEQPVLLFPWLSHCCDQHFPVFVCHSALMACSGIAPALCISLLLPERGGKGSHSSLREQFTFPLCIILSMC